MAQNRITSFTVWILWITIVTPSLFRTVSPLPSPTVIRRINNGYGYNNAAENSRIHDDAINAERASTLDKVPTDLVEELQDLNRETRAAVYGAIKRNEPNIKHLQRIPSTKLKHRFSRHQTPIDPPDSDDEDNLESLEANREAFIEILDEHAKEPRRKKPTRSHQSKIQLKYEFETKRYTITEQSDEFN